MMGKHRAHLVLKMAVNRPTGALGAILLAAILVLTCTQISGIRASYNHAVEQGARSAFGDFGYQVTGNEDVREYMLSLQDKGESVAISHARQNLVAPLTHQAATASVTTISAPAGLGVLVAGSHPHNQGEISLSSETARRLNVRIGDRVEMNDPENSGTTSRFIVSGITEDPSSVKATTAVALVPDMIDQSSAEVWLTNDDLAPINNVLSTGGGTVARVESVTARAHDNAASYQAISPEMAILFGLLFVIAMLAAIFAADRQRRNAVYRVLISLGDTPTRAALTTCAQTTILALLGGILGWLFTVVSFPFLSGNISFYFEQRWGTPPWKGMACAALVCLGIIFFSGIVSAFIIATLNKRQKRFRSDAFSHRTLLIAGILGVVLTLLFVAGRQLYLIPHGHRLAMISGAVTIPAFVYALVSCSKKTRVLDRLGNRLQKLALVGLAVVFALTYQGSLNASGVSVWTTWSDNQLAGTSSYFKVSHANEQSIKNVVEEFPELESHIAIFGDISTKDQMFRIVDGDAAVCFEQVRDISDCPRAHMYMVYVASGGLRDKDYINHASASFVQSDNSVALIGIGIPEPYIKARVKVGGVIPDSELENNILSGLILPKDAPLLRELNVQKPQSYTAIIFGFGGLPDEVRDGVRATLLAEAPFAFVTDSDDPEIRQLRAQALARQVLAVIVSGALLLALVTTIVSDQRTERRLVELGGGTALTRLRLMRPLLVAFTVTVSSAAILGRLAAMDRIPFTHLDLPYHNDYGVVWIFGLFSLLFLIPAVWMSARRLAPAEGGGEELSAAA